MFSIVVQTHPNVDKEAFRCNGVIGLKQSQRAFPLNSDVGVLKWRLNANDDKVAPLSGEGIPLKYCYLLGFDEFE